MGLKDFFIPKFIYQDALDDVSLDSVYSFKNRWKMIAACVLMITMTPLGILTFVDYTLTRKTLKAELISETTRSLNTIKNIVASFLEEKTIMLQNILDGYPVDLLMDQDFLEKLRLHLNSLSPGYHGIVAYDTSGVLKASTGMADKKMILDWIVGTGLNLVLNTGSLHETIETGKEDLSWLMISMKTIQYQGEVLVITLVQDLDALFQLLSGILINMEEDVFMMDRWGEPLPGAERKFFNQPPDYFEDFKDSTETRVAVMEDKNRETVIVGHVMIPGLQWRIFVISPENEAIAKWYQPRFRLIWALALSIFLLAIIILCSATYIVNRIHNADQKRIMALHQVEYKNKLSSISRLSSGVAHEINNPLAIINEKAGLINDLYLFQKISYSDNRIGDLTRDILSAVERCSTITRRLLNFARHMETRFSVVNPCQVLRGVLLFIRKDADYNRIQIKETIPEDIPGFYSNHGHLQQIFLNLLNNAMSAVGTDGAIEIKVTQKDDNTVEFCFSDNGCGIPQKDLHRIFEPFFSTDPGQAGKGLGLSITYGLVKEINGSIHVSSTVGQGSRFVIVLPIRAKERKQIDECPGLQENKGA